MKGIEAEKLLGGYATGTLTDTERRWLLASALDHQELFDALMDEELLRELLADPAARAQLVAALAPPKSTPFWRSRGLLGVAAGLLVAAMAGLAYLRSPRQLPALTQPEPPGPPTTGVAAVPAALQPPAAGAGPHASATPLARRTQPSSPVEAPAPPPPVAASLAEATPPALGASGAAPREAAKAGARAASAGLEGQDKLAQEAEAPVARGVGPGAAGFMGPAAAAVKAKASDRPAASVARSAPTWTLEPRSGGTTLVTISARRGAPIVLLRRTGTEVQVLQLQASAGPEGSLVQWRAEIPLVGEDALDLYQLDAPPADPARLPETGPLAGFRIRIHPPGK